MVNDDKIVNCLFSDLNNVAKVRLESVSAGEFVLVYDSIEKIYERCFVLDAADDFEIRVIDIDTLKPFKTAKDTKCSTIHTYMYSRTLSIFRWTSYNIKFTKR